MATDDASVGDRRDEGVTLPELIIVISITAFIVAVLSFALIIALRSSRATAERVMAGGSQTLSAYFPADVTATLPVGGASVDGDDRTACAGDPGGTNVLRLQLLTDPAAVVSYQVLPDNDAFRLVRVHCAAGLVRNATVLQGIADATSVAAEVRPAADNAAAIGVVILRATVGSAEPSPIEVVGSPRTPNRGPACSLVDAGPQQLVVGTGAPRRLTRATLLVVRTTGTCPDAGIDVRIATGTGTIERGLAVTAAGSGLYTTTLSPAEATWTLGDLPFAEVRADGERIGSFPVRTVEETCALAASTPAEATYEADGRLTQDVTIRLDMVGPCPSTLRLALTGGAAEVGIDVTGTGNARQGTLPRGATTWAVPPGDGDLIATGRVRTTAGTDVGRLGLRVSPAPCALANDPSRILDTDSTGQVTGNVTLTLVTTGVCGQLTLSVPTGTSTPDTFVTVTTGGPNTWTAVIPRCTIPACGSRGPTWADGLHEATVLNDGQPLQRTFGLTAREVCSYTGGAAPPTVLLVGTRLRQGTDFSVNTRGNCGPVTLEIPSVGLPTPLPMAATGTTWLLALGQFDGIWTDGPHVVTVRNNGNVLTSYTITASQACAVVDGTGSTEIRVTSENRVRAGERITFRVSGATACPGTMAVRFNPPGPTDVTTVTATRTAPGADTWVSEDLGGLIWERNETAIIYVHTSTTVFDGTTLAGAFVVEGR